MTAHLINGRAISEQILAEAAEEAARLKSAHGITSGLAPLFGDDHCPRCMSAEDRQGGYNQLPSSMTDAML